MNLFGEKPLAQFQYFTPEWAAVALVERFFPELGADDLVLEPSCGPGAFLKAIPSHVRAIGVEIDPDLAERARANTGREIICGDFTQVALPDGITAMIGNPPFAVRTIEKFLARAAHVLPEMCKCGLLLPSYAMQTHNRVARWLDRWSMQAEIIPRRLFPRLRLPLTFVIFTRGSSRSTIGFALYDEAVQVDRMAADARSLLTDGKPRANVWRALVEMEMEKLGGEASLEELYRAIEPRRPTANAWWKEKVRQQLQLHCSQVQRGKWRLKKDLESKDQRETILVIN